MDTTSTLFTRLAPLDILPSIAQFHSLPQSYRAGLGRGGGAGGVSLLSVPPPFSVADQFTSLALRSIHAAMYSSPSIL